MQAMTLSIGRAGTEFFAQTLVANQLVTMLGGLKPPNSSPPIPDFNTFGFGFSCSFSRIKINLTNGSLSGFSPSYKGVQQLNAGTPAGSQFALDLSASNFSANYNWTESYHEYCCYSGGGRFPSCHGNDYNGNYNYSPGFGKLDVTITTAFQYNQQSRTWTISTVNTSAVSSNVSPNIPARSVVQNQDTHCFSSNVSDATAKSISAIDFGALINAVVPPLLKSIPASGDLGNGIVFEWELGDAGLTFPGASGIAIGITGRVSYKGTFYQGAPPPALPVPPVPAPTESHYLQTYVSNYEVNALQWAYFQAGLLNSTATPGTIPDPDALRVKTYAPFIKELAPYKAFNMQADIKPQVAPVSAFQMVWQFTQANVDNLKSQLPLNIWTIIDNSMIGNAYTSKADLEADLNLYGIAQTYYATIENGTSAMAMVNDQAIQMVLTILTGAPPQPTITFNVTRTDILTDLKLGIAGSAQTMQFGFLKVQSLATFVSSTIPNFPGSQMAMIWATVGDPNYSQVVAAMGKTGVPLPIMSGFQFLFSQAQLSIQSGFVSIKSQVQYKSK
jgi:hypothetical protein